GYVANQTNVNVVFTDEQCSEVIGRAYDADCDVAAYALLEDVGECYPRGQTLYEVGAEIDLPAAIYERDYNGDCLPADASGVGYALSEVPLEGLATVDLKVIDRTDAFGLQMYSSSDGFQMARSAYDLRGDFTCFAQQVGPRGETESLCVGNLAYSDSSGHYGYSDDSCENAAAAT